MPEFGEVAGINARGGLTAAESHAWPRRLLAERRELEEKLADAERRFSGDDIPRPPYWSGYRVIPARFEFWQDMPFRLHDRTIYQRNTEGGWGQTKLFP